MDRTERFHLIDMMLAAPEVATFERLQKRLEVSRATLKRDLEYLRNRLNAPIIWDRETRGYVYGKPLTVGAQYELPGLWFSAEEIHALLTMQHLLANLDAGGLLGPHIQPLMSRLTGLLGNGRHPAEEIRKRIKLIPLAARRSISSPASAPRYCGANACASAITPSRTTVSANANCRRSVSSTIAKTGTWTPGAICAKACAASRWTACSTPKSSTPPRVKSPRTRWTRCWAPATAFSPAAN